jgi:hypothetical protein
MIWSLRKNQGLFLLHAICYYLIVKKNHNSGILERNISSII